MTARNRFDRLFTAGRQAVLTGTHQVDPRHLVAWVAARRQVEITELQVTGIQIVHWDYTGTGMVPIVLAAAAHHIPGWEVGNADPG